VTKMWEEQIPEEMEKATAGNWPGGLLSLLLFSLPVVMFTLPGLFLWDMVVGTYPDFSPHFFWGMWIGAVQLLYILAAGGYGALGIPAAVILFVVLT
jgi:hypothetical protein